MAGACLTCFFHSGIDIENDEKTLQVTMYENELEFKEKHLVGFHDTVGWIQ